MSRGNSLTAASGAGNGTPSPTPYQHQPPPGGLEEVVLEGCQAGVGLGLDDQNRVTMLKPSGRAAVSGLFALGDRIVTVDGQVLGDRQLQTLLQVKERHVFGVERLGATGQSLEEAFPDLAQRVSQTDDPSAARSPRRRSSRSPRSPGTKGPGLLRSMSGNFLRKSPAQPSPGSPAGSTPA